MELNISLANFNLDIERERSKRRRIGGDGMLLRGVGLEEEDLVVKMNRPAISGRVNCGDVELFRKKWFC